MGEKKGLDFPPSPTASQHAPASAREKVWDWIMSGFGQGNQNNNVDKGEFMDFRTLLRDTGFNPLGRTPGDGVTPYWDVRPGGMVPLPAKIPLHLHPRNL